MIGMTPVDPSERKRRGAWYTPPALVRFLVEQAVVPAAREAAQAGRRVRILDPACGDGRVLAAARAAVHERSDLVGIELDPVAAAVARGAVPEARIVVGDGRQVDPHGCLDAVVGNPPYLGQLARVTSRGARFYLGGGPYADVAAEFLLRAVALARPEGGRVALVLPQSILASRDTAAIRAAVLEQAALVGLWWVGAKVFEAQVNVCIVVLQRGVPQRAVRRWSGAAPGALSAAPASRLDGDTWSPLVADAAGVPPVELDFATGRLGDLGHATAGFRDQYYGLIPYVRDDGPGAPLVTAGLIDAGRCRWGQRPARFARRRFVAPRVDLGRLGSADARLASWFRSRLGPKVLVATQTRVIEAVADPVGAWLPSVPVIAVEPTRTADLWAIAAVLTAPPISAWALSRHMGAGLGVWTLKLSASQLLDLPLPRRSWPDAADQLRRGDVEGCARAMCDAYGLAPPAAEALFGWWRAGAFSP
jgi:SAM-dependent methyltransferase